MFASWISQISIAYYKCFLISSVVQARSHWWKVQLNQQPRRLHSTPLHGEEWCNTTTQLVRVVVCLSWITNMVCSIEEQVSLDVPQRGMSTNPNKKLHVMRPFDGLSRVKRGWYGYPWIQLYNPLIEIIKICAWHRSISVVVSQNIL